MPTSLRSLAGTTGMTLAVVGLSALAGCSSSSRPATESAPTTTVTTPQAAQAAPAVPAASTGATTNPATGTANARPSGTAAPPSKPAADPCPVTVTTLLHALRDSPEFNQRAAKPAALQDVTCASGYAVAGTVYDGQHQTTEIVFGFDATASRWRPLNLGSADFCEGFVPGDAAAKLTACN